MTTIGPEGVVTSGPITSSIRRDGTPAGASRCRIGLSRIKAPLRGTAARARPAGGASAGIGQRGDSILRPINK